MIRRGLAVALFAAGVSACRSIARGTSEMIAFTSDPPGATMQTATSRFCPSTPCSLDISRSEEFDATFTLPGYRPQTVPVRTKVVGTGAADSPETCWRRHRHERHAYKSAALDHTPNPVAATLVPEALPRAERARRRSPPGV